MVMLVKEKTVTTRKRHHCCWCDEWIDTGLRIYTQTCTDEDQIYTVYFHPECLAVAKEVPLDETEEGWMPGDYTRGGTEYQG